MSSAPVRSLMRARIDGLLAPLSFEFIESINRASSAAELPPQWYTLDFLAAGDERIALGIPSLMRESGVASVLLFSPQQQGDASVIDAAQLLRNAMGNYRQSDAAGAYFRILDAAPPNDLDGGDFRGAWYAVSVDLRYQFDRLVGEPEEYTT